MCVRTKFSYGCGHSYRNTEDCDSPDCAGLDKYLIEKDGDCKSCKRDGSVGTRGRDGLGRYAQEIRRLRERSRSTTYERSPAVSSSESVVQRSTTDALHDETPVSPWARSLIRERPWESPHRKQADDAWLSEHESRLTDLQTRLESVHIARQHDSSPPIHRRALGIEEIDDVEEERRYEAPIKKSYMTMNDNDLIDDLSTSQGYVVEVRKRSDNIPSHHSRSQSGRSYHTEVRQYSYDSLPDSMPSYRSSPRHKSRSTMRYGYPEQNYEYDYYTGHTAPRSSTKRSSGRAKTEPYSYSRSNAGYDYDYDYPHPIAMDSTYSYGNPKYYLPHRSSGYRYRPHDHTQLPSSYARYHVRY